MLGLSIDWKQVRLCGIIILLTWQSITLWSQATGDPREDFLYGEYYIAQDLFQEAIPFYLSALKENPDNSNINYRIGSCYMKIIGEQHNALPYLEKAVVQIDEHYIEGRYKDPSAPVEAWLLLGDAYHRENELLKASFAYHQYKKLIENSDSHMLDVVIKKIMDLGISSEYQRYEQDVRIINMGKIINSRFSDYNPVLSGDQKTLIYTQFWETFDRIMISHRTPDGWTDPELLNDKIGSVGNCYTSALSFDGTELYLIWHDALNYEIYVTNFKDGEWSKMVPISGKVNTRFRESSVTISADGYYLYFSSDRPGGEGGFDIYRAQREGDEWNNVINLGKVINTEKNEEAPYITYDGTTLYFASNGHETIGNMDILFSELNGSGNWTIPVNVGLPVNTSRDDIFYIYFSNTKTGYLARDLAEGFGKNDLYQVQQGNDPKFAFGDSFSKSSGSESHMHENEFNNLSAGGFTNSEPASSITQKADLETTTEMSIEQDNSEEMTYPEKEVTSVTDDSIISDNKNQEISKESSQVYMSVETNNPGSPEPKIAENAQSQPINVIDSPVDESLSDSDYRKKEDTESDKSLITYTQSAAERTPIEDDKYYNPLDRSSQEYPYGYVPDYTILPDSIPTYTIQLYALRNRIDPKRIKLGPLVVSKGDDELHRYTYGEYKGYSKALEELDTIRKSGFPDAFIRNITTVQNYLGYGIK